MGAGRPAGGAEQPVPLTCGASGRYSQAMPELDPIISEFATTEEAEAHDRWVREKVQASLDDPRPDIPHDEVMAEMRALIDSYRRAPPTLET